MIMIKYSNNQIITPILLIYTSIGRVLDEFSVRKTIRETRNSTDELGHIIEQSTRAQNACQKQRAQFIIRSHLLSCLNKKAPNRNLHLYFLPISQPNAQARKSTSAMNCQKVKVIMVTRKYSALPAIKTKVTSCWSKEMWSLELRWKQMVKNSNN